MKPITKATKQPTNYAQNRKFIFPNAKKIHATFLVRTRGDQCVREGLAVGAGPGTAARDARSKA